MSNRKIVLNYNFIVAALALALSAICAPAVATPPPPGTVLGGEMQVNGTATGNQIYPSAAADAYGDRIVVWQGPDADGNGIYAQRYTAEGAAIGSEFAVNSITTGEQSNAAVAMDAVGNFVVVWQGPDANGKGVYARRYDSSGAAQGGEILVNTYTNNDQDLPGVAMAALGGFVVVWESNLQIGLIYGKDIYGQRYAANGAPQGGEFLVDTGTGGDQTAPSVAMDADGDFVVAWETNGISNGIKAQRYAASGAAAGVEFKVNTTQVFETKVARAAMDEAGDFVIAWEDGQSGAGNGLDVYVQRYLAGGSPAGAQSTVNTTLASDQQNPAVGMDAAGDFTIAWESTGQDGEGQGVYAQRYDSSGTPLGTEFGVNSYTPSDQGLASVALDAAGGAMVAWVSLGEDGDGYGIYAMRYSGSRTADLAADMSVDPAGVVMPGTVLALTAHVSNSAAASASGDTAIATVENARASVTGASLSVTLPAGSDLVSLLGSWGSSCSGSTQSGYTCHYSAHLGPGAVSPPLTFNFTAPGSGGLALYTDTASSDDAADTDPDNDLGATGVFVIGPIVSDALLAVNHNTATGGTLQGADMNDAPLSYSKASNPAHGTVTVGATGQFTYKPASNYVGADSFTFKAAAGGFDSNIGTVSITVTEHTPVAKAASFIMSRNTTHLGRLTASDADKGDKLSYKKVSGPLHGSVTVGSTGAFSYTPKANFHGHDSFAFRVSDGLASDTAVISITVK